MMEIPVIDITGLRSADRPTRAAVAAELGSACRGIGFFYVTGLGAMSPAVADGSGNCPASNGLCTANAMPTVKTASSVIERTT